MFKKSLMSAITVLMLMAVIVSGCSSPSETEAPSEPPAEEAPAEEVEEEAVTSEEKETFTIGYVVMNFTNPLYSDEMNIVKQLAEHIGGIEMIFKSCDSSLEKQVTIIENFIEQGVDLIIADPIDTKAAADVFDKASAAGIYMLSNSAPIPTKLESYYIDFPFEKYFGAVAYATFEALDGKGNVVLLQGQLGHPVNTQRQDGFDEALSHYPDIKVLDQQPSEWDAAIGLQVVENWITTYGEDLDAIIVMFDGVVPSIVELLKSKGLQDKILVAGNDGELNVLDYMTKGEVVADCIFGSSRSAAEAIYFANEILLGRNTQNSAPISMYVIVDDALKEKMLASDEVPDDLNYCTAQEAIDLFNNYATEYKEKYGY